MARSSSGPAAGIASKARDTKFLVRVVLGALLAANLVAAGFVLFPPGGSAESLERQLESLQSQATVKKAVLDRTREHAASVEKGRAEGDKFIATYFLPRRTAFSTLIGDLDAAAVAAKIKPKERSFTLEPIEGSDTLSMMTITANFEGSYRDVMSFVHALDQSSRLMIIESLNTAPQQGTNTQSVSLKINAFVREEGL
jgi:type IV pilus assembly protein PilO